MERLRRRFPHTLKLDFEPGAQGRPERPYAARAAATRPELDVCCEFLAHVRGGSGATDTERALLAEAVESSRVIRAARDDESGSVADPGQEVA
jgi:exonuclease SbcD